MDAIGPLSPTRSQREGFLARNSAQTKSDRFNFTPSTVGNHSRRFVFPSERAQLKPNFPQVNRYLIGLFATLPLIVLQVLFLSDIFSWYVVLSEGLLPHAVMALVVAWLIFAGFETHRRGNLTGCRQLPWFAFTCLIFIGTFTYFGSWTRPIVMDTPSWCRISQVATWRTSKPRANRSSPQSYILVLNGVGNESSYRFKSGWLNWTGDEQAGLPRFELDQSAYFHWIGYTEVSVPLTAETLRERMLASGLPEAEFDRLSREIWHCLELAMAGSPVVAPNAELSEPKAGPGDYEDVKLGALVWAVLLLGAMQLVAQTSLPPTLGSDGDNIPGPKPET